MVSLTILCSRCGADAPWNSDGVCMRCLEECGRDFDGVPPSEAGFVPISFSSHTVTGLSNEEADRIAAGRVSEEPESPV